MRGGRLWSQVCCFSCAGSLWQTECLLSFGNFNFINCLRNLFVCHCFCQFFYFFYFYVRCRRIRFQQSAYIKDALRFTEFPLSDLFQSCARSGTLGFMTRDTTNRLCQRPTIQAFHVHTHRSTRTVSMSSQSVILTATLCLLCVFFQTIV